MNITPEQLLKIKEAMSLAGYFAENPSREQTANDKATVKAAWEALYEVEHGCKPLTDEQKAFIKSFKDTHDQYEIKDKAIVAFLHGDDSHFTSCFDGYTQLADARNLWWDAINFAKGNTK
jgi:hypothetical protein